ncbi:tRNA threonylcarbamoyladenosine biosynthesis protein TsaE [Bacillus mesophilus]|uniref:tRNA threonylcarbamoyladenosine biosynthesis protein TsaE n=1 Tax=Bacillus mesophilus TaxID=1808955 RepID=A0A6M0QCY2_9BACI|nr:tRNA (adenosine(37)-N6)-threonylcarbamoyltransferase complex ATPase subunit type 1 TsaE [Bacillus mesophilus]MBM7663316.1 tRNA threonylcarbamoyladenosine biosynthesis protein TsaE [Bacillus mesophilus]NEY74097.1 tRNA (adenosine(37)-N6)-threonylcarbamoyltransferase complex ATPase subunit type 1 TsaE [Bacillus mesophilus]
MKTNSWITNNEEETRKFASNLGQLVRAGDVILLEGDLGAGKTTFTKGLAEGLGVTRTVNSPTFTIIKEYNGRIPLYHMDVYRVSDEFEDLGFDEYFHGSGVTVVEWAHLIQEQLPSKYACIKITREDDQKRKIVYQAVGERYEQLGKELNKHENTSN